MSPSSERKTLADPVVKQEREALIIAPHVAPLNALVQRIRTEQGCNDCVPYFDPTDGGTDAEVLMVLEAPGPKAISSGFISCDNPDLTARNMTEFLETAGICRKQVVLWNIVPWYLGTGRKIIAARRADTKAGLVYLQQLLPLLPRVRAVVFVGRPAQRATKGLELSSAMQRFEAFHPSPQFVHRHPDNRRHVLLSFQDVAAYLKR